MLRVPEPPIELHTLDGGTRVGADYRVTPLDGVIFSDESPLPGHAYTDGTYVDIGKYRGAVTLRATHGKLVATLGGYVYDAIDLNCAFGASASPLGSDIYQTGSLPARPAVGFTCSQTAFPLHTPYGGTLLRYGSNRYVGDVSASAWRNDFTVVPQLDTGDILLFRTNDGRVVKCLMQPPSAAYIIAPPGGEFGDYLAWHSHRKLQR